MCTDEHALVVNRRKLCAETLDLLIKLGAFPSSKWLSWSRANELCATIGELGGRGEMLAAAPLLRFARDGNSKVAHAAAAVVRALLSGVKPLDLVFLTNMCVHVGHGIPRTTMTRNSVLAMCSN